MATVKKATRVTKDDGIPTAAAMRLRSKEGRLTCVLEAMDMAARGGNLTVQLFDQQAPLDAELSEKLRTKGYEVSAQQAYKDPDNNARWVVTISWA